MFLLNSALALTAVVALVAACGWQLARLAARLGQPAIVAQLLGAAASGLATPAWFGSRATVERLSVLGQIGLALYVVHVGARLRRPSPATAGAAARVCALVLVVCVPVAALAVACWPALVGAAAGGQTVLALTGVAAAGGLPVVARVLQERGVLDRPAAVLAVVCSAALMATGLALGEAATLLEPASSTRALPGQVVALGALAGAGALLLRAERLTLATWSAGAAAVTLLSVWALGSPYVGCFVAGLAALAGPGRLRQALGAVERPVAVVLIPVFLVVAAAPLSPGALTALPAVLLVAAALQAARAVATGAALRPGAGPVPLGLVAAVSCSGVLGLAVAQRSAEAGTAGAQLTTIAFAMGLASTALIAPLLRCDPASVRQGGAP